MDLVAALERWRALNDRSPRTFESYRWQLRALARRGIVDSSDVTLEAIASFIGDRRRDGIMPPTINQALGAVVAALSALAKSGELADKKLVKKIRKLRIKVKRPRRFTARHIDRAGFLRLCSCAKNREPRLLLPLQLATLAGLRAGELARLRGEDVELGPSPSLLVRMSPELGAAGLVKTGSERRVPICQELRALLEAAPRKGYLFPARSPSGFGRPPTSPFMTVKTLGRELRRLVRGTELERFATWQVLRHTRASWWAQAGVSLAKIALWLGHSIEVCERFYAALREGYDPDCERAPAA